MQAITADYTERIVIPPEDVMPKSSWFRFVKLSLIISICMLMLMAILTVIVTESSNPNPDGLAIGIISLVSKINISSIFNQYKQFHLFQLGIVLFLVGLIGILKEHIPIVLAFAISMIVYLLIFMYSRVIDSPGLIILRTFILVLLAVESFCFSIMIRDWKQMQLSRLNQRMMKSAQMAQYAATGGVLQEFKTGPAIITPGNMYGVHQYGPYDMDEGHYTQIGPGTTQVAYNQARYYE